MLHIDQENCGTMIRDDKGFDNRVTSGIFMFLKGSIEDLKKCSVIYGENKVSNRKRRFYN